MKKITKNKISRFYKIFEDFNLKTKTGKKEFIDFFLVNYNKDYKLKDYKSEVIKIIEEWK